MNRTIVAAALGATAFAGAALAWRRSRQQELLQRIESSNVIPIITPVIEIPTAEYVLSRMEHMPLDDVTLVLHTEGGCVTSCVMIADALRKFTRSTAIVPYMAISGGTLIALNAKKLAMGRNAVLSAVDPQIFGQRARHIPEADEDGLHPLAQEYDSAVSQYLRTTLTDRLRDHPDPKALDRAMSVFMGENAPHAWPIKVTDLARLGLPVETTSRQWAGLVDEYRLAIDLRTGLALRGGRCRR
jgi:membrane-bound ClpP family serine protease